MICQWVNPLNAKLNPICHLLALLGACPILHVSRVRVKWKTFVQKSEGGGGTCTVGKHSTQKFYLHEYLPLFLQDLNKKTQHQVLLNQETTYTSANFSVMSSGSRRQVCEYSQTQVLCFLHIYCGAASTVALLHTSTHSLDNLTNLQ